MAACFYFIWFYFSSPLNLNLTCPFDLESYCSHNSITIPSAIPKHLAGTTTCFFLSSIVSPSRTPYSSYKLLCPFRHFEVLQRKREDAGWLTLDSPSITLPPSLLFVTCWEEGEGCAAWHGIFGWAYYSLSVTMRRTTHWLMGWCLQS